MKQWVLRRGFLCYLGSFAAVMGLLYYVYLQFDYIVLPTARVRIVEPVHDAYTKSIAGVTNRSSRPAGVSNESSRPNRCDGYLSILYSNCSCFIGVNGFDDFKFYKPHKPSLYKDMEKMYGEETVSSLYIFFISFVLWHYITSSLSPPPSPCCLVLPLFVSHFLGPPSLLQTCHKHCHDINLVIYNPCCTDQTTGC